MTRRWVYFFGQGQFEEKGLQGMQSGSEQEEGDYSGRGSEENPLLA